MTLLSTSPQTHTVLRIEQLRPAAINVALIKQDDSPVDLTGCTLRVTIAQLPYRGGAVLHTQLATAVDLALGLMRFDIQGDDLDFAAGTYPFAMTLVTAEGFQTTIVKGEIDLQANPDSAVPPDYTAVAPPLGLTVALLDNSRITVKVNHHPDSVLMAFADAAEVSYQSAQIAAQAASASAASAAASAEAAEAIVIADFGTVLDATFPDKVVSPFQPIREALDDIYAPEYITGLVEGGYLDQISLDAAYADQATETTVSTGRLSLANLVASARGIDSFTTAARDALTGAALWDGRQIYNTTTDRMNRYDTGAGAWREIADMQDLATLLTSSTPTTTPSTAGTGVVGVSNFAARSDHVHPAPAWQAYTPSLVSGTIGTGAGSLAGRYIQVGKLIHFEVKWVLGTGFVISSNTVIGTPTARANGLGIYGPNVKVAYVDTPAGNMFLGIGIQWSTGVSPYFLGANGIAANFSSPPFTVSAGDEVYVAGTYESV